MCFLKFATCFNVFARNRGSSDNASLMLPNRLHTASYHCKSTTGPGTRFLQYDLACFKLSFIHFFDWVSSGQASLNIKLTASISSGSIRKNASDNRATNTAKHLEWALCFFCWVCLFCFNATANWAIQSLLDIREWRCLCSWHNGSNTHWW